MEEAIRLNLMICKNRRLAHYLLLNTNGTTAKLKCNSWSLIEILETRSAHFLLDPTLKLSKTK